MSRHQAALRLFTLLVCMLVISSCQKGPSLNPPSDTYRTALVLPVQLDNRAQYGKHGFEYSYRIEKLDGSIEPLEVLFRFPIKGGMVIVDSLPPGDYRISQFRFQPRGSGNFSYGNNIQQRADRFRLERNRITILDKSLYVLVYNQTPGRGMTRTYEFRMIPLNRDQRERVIESLRQLENFDSWTIRGEGVSAQGAGDDSVEIAYQTLNQAQKSSVQPLAGSSLEGYYQSEITSDHYAVFRHGKHRKLKIRFTQEGDRVTGIIDESGQQLEGRRVGDVVRFSFALPGFGYDIEGEWRLTADNTNIEGSWYFAAYGARGEWNLRRLPR